MRQPKRFALLGALLLVMLGRLFLQQSLRAAGFEALTADDFGRVVFAARWAINPHPLWHGPWLPFHTYFVGFLLTLNWELLYLPRLIGSIVGFVSLGLMYLLSLHLFQSKLTALTSTVLLALNPAHTWLALTPLTELLNFALLITCSLWLVRYEDEHKKGFLLLGLFPLMIATATRFESWGFGATLVIYFVLKAVYSLLKGGEYIRNADWLAVGAAGAAVSIFPLAWILGNYLETGNGLYFLTINRAFDMKWYGNQRDYLAYWNTLFKIDPLTTMLALPSVLVCLYKNRTLPRVRMYMCLIGIPFAFFVLLQGGQVQPYGNYIRYLSQFLFPLYPVVSWLIVLALRTLFVKRATAVISLCMFIIVMATIQVPSMFKFQNDPAVEGLRVGQRLREIWADDPSNKKKPVLIELNYWQYLGIHVGANDIFHIIYDRPLDFSLMNNSTSSLDKQVIQNCVAYYHIGYIIVRDPKLLQLVKTTLQALPSEKVDNYSIFYVDQATYSKRTGQCPLVIGKGY